MKTILRSTVVNAIGLYTTALILSGLHIGGGYFTLIEAGLVLMILGLVLKPILSIVALPINLVTFGMASFLVNAIVLLILTLLIPQISITEFTFPGYTFGGFVIPKIFFNTFFAYVIIASIFSAVTSFIYWLFS